MHLVTSADRHRKGDYEKVSSRKFVSPAVLMIFVIAAVLGVFMVSYFMGPKVAVVATKTVEPRPELYQNPYGHIVAIAETDGKLILVTDAKFAERRKEIGSNYDLVYVSLDWKLKKPVKK